MSRVRALALSVGLLVCWGCDKQEVLIEAEGPVRARILSVDKNTLGGSGNHLVCAPEIIHHHYVVMEVDDQSIQLHHPVKEDDLALALDPSGERVAWRSGDDPWHVVYVRERALFHGGLSTDVDQDDVDWRSVPDWSVASREICVAGSDACEGVISDTLRQGQDALAALLGDIAHMPVNTWRDPWEEGRVALDAPHRASLDAALRAALSPQTPPPVLVRAALYLDLSPADLAVALQASSQLTSAEDPKRGKEPQALARLLLLGARAELPQAGLTACQRWTEIYAVHTLSLPLCDAPNQHSQSPCLQPHDKREVVTSALLTLLAQGTPCEAAAQSPPPLPAPCSLALRCGDGPDALRPLCAPDQVRAEVTALLQAPNTPLDRISALWHLRAQPPQALLLPNARRNYDITAQGPDCDLAMHKGQPCTHPQEKLAEAACRASSGTDPDENTDENAEFVINDLQKQIGPVTARRSAALERVMATPSGACGITTSGEGQCWAMPFHRMELSSPPSLQDEPGPKVSARNAPGWLSPPPAPLKGVWGWSGYSSDQIYALTQQGTLWQGQRQGPLERAQEVSAAAVTRRQLCVVQGQPGVLRCGEHNPDGGLEAVAPLLAPGVRQVQSALSLLCAQTDQGELWCWDDQAGDGEQTPTLLTKAAPTAALSMWPGGACLLEGARATCWFLRDQRPAWSFKAPAGATALRPTAAGLLWESPKGWRAQRWLRDESSPLALPVDPRAVSGVTCGQGTCAWAVVDQAGALRWWWMTTETGCSSDSPLPCVLAP